MNKKDKGWSGEPIRHSLASKGIEATNQGSSKSQKNLQNQNSDEEESDEKEKIETILNESAIPNCWNKFGKYIDDDGKLNYVFNPEIDGKPIPIFSINIYPRDSGSKYLTTSVDIIEEEIANDISFSDVNSAVYDDIDEMKDVVLGVMISARNEFNDNREKFESIFRT